MANIRYTEASTKSGPVTRCQIIIQNGWLHWLVTRYGGFFQAEELNLDLGQRKGFFPFGNTGVLCLPDTITSSVLVGTLTKTKIRVAFSHPSAFPWGWGPGQERLSGTIVTGSVLRMLVTLSPKSAVTELQMMRKQFLAKDLSLINQEKRKEKKKEKSQTKQKKTRSFQDSFPGNYPG